MVAKVLDALSAPAGKDDDRTREQRYHDALAEAMRRLVAAKLLPERAGAAGEGVGAHLPGRPDAPRRRFGTAGAVDRAGPGRVGRVPRGASETGSDGGVWLDGDAAEGIACDAAMAPIVTGDVNIDALEDLVRLCVELDRLRRGGDGPGRPAADTTAAWAALEQAVIGKAVDLLSGPGGLAQLPAPPAARRPAGRAEPAAGHRVRRDDPGRDPQRGDPAGPALPVGRAMRPARRRLPGAPHQAQGQRRGDLRQGLRAPVLVPPPDRDPPVGLDPGPEPRRHHHRLEQGQDQDPAQPRTPGPAG